MKRLLFLFILIFLTTEGIAQYGIRMSYANSNAPNWEELLVLNTPEKGNQYFGSGFNIGIDYWARLPQKRIEFYPELSISRYKKSYGEITNPGTFRSSLINLGLNTHFYIFDFKGDCDCPTFSKKGNLLKKGFFLSAKLGLQNHAISLNEGRLFNDISPTAGVGMGLDIGVTDLLTISPFVQYNVAFKDSWDKIGPTHQFPDNPELLKSSFRQVFIGFRIGFRPDYK